MNFQLKKLLLLPSLILANAYLMVGNPIVSENNTNSDSYSLKIKHNLTESELDNDKTIEVSSLSNSDSILILNLLVASFCLLLLYRKPIETKKYNTVFSNLKFKYQYLVFLFIKTLNKTFHCLYSKFYISSL